MTIWLELSKRPRKDGWIYSGNKVVLHTASEDVLTANVFGIMKNLDPRVWLLDMPKGFLGIPVEFRDIANLRFHFWKRYRPIKEYRNREGQTEIDVTMESDRLVIFVECKYKSELATRTTYDVERDQIVRNLDVGLGYSREINKRFYLLIVTNDPQPPGLFLHYREHPNELIRKLPYRRQLDLASCLAWTNWKEIGNALNEKIERFSAVERRYIDDLLQHLRTKT